MDRSTLFNSCLAETKTVNQPETNQDVHIPSHRNQGEIGSYYCLFYLLYKKSVLWYFETGVFKGNVVVLVFSITVVPQIYLRTNGPWHPNDSLLHHWSPSWRLLVPFKNHCNNLWGSLKVFMNNLKKGPYPYNLPSLFSTLYKSQQFHWCKSWTSVNPRLTFYLQTFTLKGIIRYLCKS